MNRREMILRSVAASIVLPALPAPKKQPAFSGLDGRPSVEKRNFRSLAVEQAIEKIRASLASPELGRIFANCLPNTLDTTVFFNVVDGQPDTFVITGDIDAMWLRDSSAQVWPYLSFVKDDPELGQLIEGVIRRQARLIQIDPYANAFVRSVNDPPLPAALHDRTEMLPGVGERKWEIDSLCFPVRLAYGYWKATGSRAPFDEVWHNSARRIVATFQEQQRFNGNGPYRFQRETLRATATLALSGYGNPARPNGLIRSEFRPSDDACIFPYFLPANLFAAQALKRIAEIAETIYADAQLASTCTSFAQELRQTVMRLGQIQTATHGRILAYEIDGYGGLNLMDDANAPGLLSLSYLGLLPSASSLCRNSRQFALSQDNPYFFHGLAGEGIGGPHVGVGAIWPMSIIMRAFTSESDAEIAACLQTLCTTTAGTNFMHESFNENDASRYTRPWFAWANGLFGELILKLHAERPGLLHSWTLAR